MIQKPDDAAHVDAPTAGRVHGASARAEMFRESALYGVAIALGYFFLLELYCDARAIGSKQTTSSQRDGDGVALVNAVGNEAEDAESGLARVDDAVEDDVDERGQRRSTSGGARGFAACAMLDPIALRENRPAIQAAAELGVIMFLFWFCDRSGLVRDAKKAYDRDLFLAVFVALAAYGWKTALKKSKSTSALHREQTEEMKGWMQVLFLLYHYFDAGEMYNLIRVFIAAYVWMTGFGNFSFYYVKKDFSATRFAQMMWRLNFFVFVTCAVMKNDYMLYYICPLHTLFTLFVFGALAIGREKNSDPRWVYAKFACCFLLSVTLWEVPGLFKRVFRPFVFIFGYTNPAKPHGDPLHEWRFRSGLDRYVWIYGMMCAYAHPRYEAVLKWIDDRQSTRERYMYQGGIIIVASMTLLWWWQTFMKMDKFAYNEWHPYTSWIPITAFILLRNATKALRKHHIELFCICGKVTLETYIAQFHIWLSTAGVPNGQPKALMSLVTGYPLLNLIFCSYIYVGISHRIFDVTNVLKSVCVPKESSDTVRAVTNAGIFMGTTFGLGAFMSLMFTGTV